MTTACKNCAYVIQEGIDGWHSSYCDHPDVRLPKEFDPFAGEMVEAIPILPRIEDINKGNCKLFKAVKEK